MNVSWHFVLDYSSLNYEFIVHEWSLSWRNCLVGFWCLPNNSAKAGHSSGSETIFTNWKQYVANMIRNWLKLLIHNIALSSVSTSEMNKGKTNLTFVASIKPSKLSIVLYHPCSEKKNSLSFEEPFIKQHRPRIDDRFKNTTCCVVFFVFNTCDSVQNVDYVSINLNICLGSMSKFLKSYYSFLSK